MLNTRKLLYILPDVAYVAELLPGKKPSTFTIQAFRQVNGEFLDDNEFIGENVLKLIQKLEPDEYHLVLPDFLFTNTIVTVNEKSDSKIKAYLKDKLLPELELTPDTHHIDTTILTEHGDATKVQLSALEKSVLEPLQVSFEQTSVKISGISPLSWTIKSLVSLEPSISVVQMGTMLYTALHYIGVDQTTQAKVDEVDNIYETIKTLKGTEPSIQTVYLLSNELVEEKLKEHLSDTLPIQQLASQLDPEAKMPSYVQKAIEAGMRTLSIEEYPVPKFELGKAPAGATIKTTAPAPAAMETVVDDEELPKPTGMVMVPEPEPIVLPAAMAVEELHEEPPAAEVVEEKVDETDLPAHHHVPEEAQERNLTEPDDDIDALLESLQVNEPELSPHHAAPIIAHSPVVESPQPSPTIIKNNNRTKTMLKMVFVTLAVFFATVGIGIGLGLGVLQLSQNKTQNPVSPVVEASPSPTLPSPTPTPSASPAAALNKKAMSILVANATTKAGYAGQIGTKLTKADFGTVKTGNAKGDYKPGNYVLMTTKDQALIDALQDATGLTLTYQADQVTEDPKTQYNAVLVLAQ